MLQCYNIFCTRISGPDGPLILVTHAYYFLQGMTAALTDFTIINADYDLNFRTTFLHQTF